MKNTIAFFLFLLINTILPSSSFALENSENIDLYGSNQASRFKFSDDQNSIFDTQTNLEWSSAISNEELTFPQDQDYCSSHRAGEPDWRVPSMINPRKKQNIILRSENDAENYDSQKYNQPKAQVICVRGESQNILNQGSDQTPSNQDYTFLAWNTPGENNIVKDLKTWLIRQSSWFDLSDNLKKMT